MNLDWQSVITDNSWLLFAAMLWDAVWRGIALWKSARSAQRNWFVALFIVNSVGILPIIYLKFFQKKTRGKSK